MGKVLPFVSKQWTTSGLLRHLEMLDKRRWNIYESAAIIRRPSYEAKQLDNLHQMFDCLIEYYRKYFWLLVKIEKTLEEKITDKEANHR